MNLTILKCHSGHLKISIPKFKVDTTKYNCLNNGDKILNSINYINEDSILSCNKDVLINKNRRYLKFIKLPLPDFVNNIIIDYIPLTILFDELPISNLKILIKNKTFNFLINELNNEKEKYHQEKIYYMYNDEWEYNWCKECVDRIDEEIYRFKIFNINNNKK